MFRKLMIAICLAFYCALAYAHRTPLDEIVYIDNHTLKSATNRQSLSKFGVVDVDYVGDNLYWVDTDGHGDYYISTATYDNGTTSNVTDQKLDSNTISIRSHQAFNVTAIAVDPTNRYTYLAISGQPNVAGIYERSRGNGKFYRVVRVGTYRDPDIKHIAVSRGILYFYQNQMYAFDLSRNFPNGIPPLPIQVNNCQSMDVNNRYLYWTESTLGSITMKRMGITSNFVETVSNPANLSKDIAVDNHHVYYSQTDGKIHSQHIRDNRNRNVLLSSLNRGNIKIAVNKNHHYTRVPLDSTQIDDDDNGDDDNVVRPFDPNDDGEMFPIAAAAPAKPVRKIVILKWGSLKQRK